MAEEEAAGEAGKGGLEALKKKIGPLPLGVWLVIAAGIFWYVKSRGSGAATAATSGSQTDPAGNVGSIDPATGYVYGSPEDQAAVQSNSGDSGTVTGTGGSTVAGAYPDNPTWASAAINYLVGIGIDPTAANSAIEQFLASQPLTTQQQADVNSAVQRLGAPPDPPQPGTAPSPIVSPPSAGTVYATNPPTGLTVSSKATTSVGLKWNKATNATAYTVSYGTTSAATGGSTTVTGTATSTTVSGLKAGTLYYFRVQGTPAKPGDGFASTSATTTKSASTTPAPTSGTKAKAPIEHKAVKGDTFSALAAKYKVPGGGQGLYEYQLSTPLHTASAKATIKSRGADLIEIGETIYIPQ